jgi:hypothetical protein
MGPFSRLFLITGMVLLGGFCAVFALRLVGLSQPPPSADIRDLKKPALFVTSDLDTGPKYSRAALESIRTDDPGVVLTLELRASQDREWVIFGAGDLSSSTSIKGPVESKTWPLLKSATWNDPRGGVGLVRLKDFLQDREIPRLMLVIHNREVAASQTLLEIIGRRDHPLVTLTFSPNHRLNREMHKKRPWWFAGVDNVTLTQWHVLAALGLESFISADFFWLPRGLFAADSKLSPRIQNEIKRRQMGFLVNDEAAGSFELMAPLLGILTDRPNHVFSKMAR